ncbi:DUF29 domain-containing protein [Egbenema bharatensis]|uniref:DUF29 domain-containing protein n=1 Tax=Egbenema bharatensis TaxID=3463334 RepID=UPI003A88D236
MTSLYDTDFYAWTQQQAQRLQAKDWHRLDILHLVEELEDLGRRERQELRNRLGILLGHLLKWQFQSQHRSNGWLATIREQREQIGLLLAENPSLQPYLLEALTIAYKSGLNLAVQETGLPYTTFPASSPYSLEDALGTEFFPEP